MTNKKVTPIDLMEIKFDDMKTVALTGFKEMMSILSAIRITAKIYEYDGIKDLATVGNDIGESVLNDIDVLAGQFSSMLNNIGDAKK